MCDNAAIPLNWKSFRRLDDNKKELFEYLAARVQSLRLHNLEVISTAALGVISPTTIERAWHLATVRRQMSVSSSMQIMTL